MHPLTNTQAGITAKQNSQNPNVPVEYKAQQAIAHLRPLGNFPGFPNTRRRVRTMTGNKCKIAMNNILRLPMCWCPAPYQTTDLRKEHGQICNSKQ